MNGMDLPTIVTAVLATVPQSDPAISEEGTPAPAAPS